jgi:hypothetical protein
MRLTVLEEVHPIYISYPTFHPRKVFHSYFRINLLQLLNPSTQRSLVYLSAINLGSSLSFALRSRSSRYGIEGKEGEKERGERNVRSTITPPQRFHQSKRIAHSPTFLDINRDVGFQDDKDRSLLSAFISYIRPARSFAGHRTKAGHQHT